MGRGVLEKKNERGFDYIVSLTGWLKPDSWTHMMLVACEHCFYLKDDARI